MLKKVLVLGKYFEGKINETEIVSDGLHVKVIAALIDSQRLCSQRSNSLKYTFMETGIIGIVEKVSKMTVSNFGVDAGDRVYIEPSILCNKCATCLKGHYSACKKHICYGLGLEEVDKGKGFGHIAISEGSRVHKLPDDIDTRAAQILTILGKAFYAISKKGNVSLGKSVIVLGNGLFGVLCAICARLCGSTSVTLVLEKKPDDRLMDYLINFGVRLTDDVPEKYFDVLIDACGKVAIFDRAVVKLIPLGLCVLTFGYADYHIPVKMLMNHEIVITGMNNSSWCFDQIIKILINHPEISDVIQTLSYGILKSFNDVVYATYRFPYTNIVIRP